MWPGAQKKCREGCVPPFMNDQEEITFWYLFIMAFIQHPGDVIKPSSPTPLLILLLSLNHISSLPWRSHALTNQKSRLHPNLLCCRQLPHVVCSLKSITSSGGEEARHLGACVCVCTLWLSRKPHLSFTHRLSAADFGDSVSRAAGKWKRGA